MIVTLQTKEGDHVAVQTAHIAYAQALDEESVEVTMINNKKFVLKAKFWELLTQINATR